VFKRSSYVSDKSLSVASWEKERGERKLLRLLFSDDSRGKGPLARKALAWYIPVHVRTPSLT